MTHEEKVEKLNADVKARDAAHLKSICDDIKALKAQAPEVGSPRWRELQKQARREARMKN